MIGQRLGLAGCKDTESHGPAHDFLFLHPRLAIQREANHHRAGFRIGEIDGDADAPRFLARGEPRRGATELVERLHARRVERRALKTPHLTSSF